MIVSKFGGSSVARIQSLANILKISKDKRRKIFVFSALGKENENDSKITDLLIKYFDEKNNLKKRKIFNKIRNKFKSLINLVCVNIEFSAIFNYFQKNKNKNYIISRGEYITAKIMSKYLEIKYVPAEYIIRFNDGVFDETETTKRANKFLKKYGRFCTGGFYGYDSTTKQIVLFDRGGGDTTGAILSKITQSKIYENFTDVDGVKAVNPNIVKDAKTIKKMSYQDMKEISLHDGRVLHQSVCDILANTKVKTIVKNIYNPKFAGTIITDKARTAKYVCFKLYQKSASVIASDGKNKRKIICERKDVENVVKKEYQKLYGD